MTTKWTSRAAVGAMLALLALSGPNGAVAGTLAEDIEQAAQGNFPEYLELLRYRNVPDVPADIARNAAFLERLFERRGFRVRQIDYPAGRPVVLAEFDAGVDGLPTVLFYLH